VIKAVSVMFKRHFAPDFGIRIIIRKKKKNQNITYLNVQIISYKMYIHELTINTFYTNYLINDYGKT